jgi:HTH-type transcriptional regulator, sugar sensing transcriptional regulator
MAASSVGELLVPFGFTNLESEIYAFLLGESPATGYRIAQAIGKPAANTYKAIQTLQAKGAVLVEEGANRMCRAIPADELLARLQGDFDARKKAAQAALERIGKPSDDDRIYYLRSKEQVLGRARVMLGAAKQQVLLKCPNDVLEELRANLEDAIERGVDVCVLAPSETVVGNVQAATEPFALPGEVSLLTDGDQYLSGQLADDRTEAIWTRSPFLVPTAHQGLSAQITLAEVAEQLRMDEKKSRIQRTVETRRVIGQ